MKAKRASWDLLHAAVGKPTGDQLVAKQIAAEKKRVQDEYIELGMTSRRRADYKRMMKKLESK